MNAIEQKIYDLGLIPVIKIEDPEKAVPLARALCDGGLPAAEITFRTACAAEAIAKIAKEVPEMLVGAGTVLTPEQADAAIAAGAQFIVSPGLNPRVVRHCIEKKIPILPGCANPSDIECALELGLTTVKFFPAEAAGGLPMLKAMSAPYGAVRFMPTGGISSDNLLSYLKFDKILACGGSFMVKDELIREGNFEEITRLTKNAVMAMLGLKFCHLGMNNESQEEADKGAAMLSKLFGLPLETTSKGYFAGKEFEVLNAPIRGKYGHIAISTNFVDRAIAYFKRMGIEFDESTATYDAKGKPKFIYFKDEICGFAFHLVSAK